MNNKFIVNSFSMPNAIIDEALSKMSGNAFKCYALIARQTTGWNRQHDRISVSQFIAKSGIKDERTVSNALLELEDLNLIKAIRKRGEITSFALNFDIGAPSKNVPTKNEGGTKNVPTKNVPTKNEGGTKNVPTKNEGGSTPKKWGSTKDNIKNNKNNIILTDNITKSPDKKTQNSDFVVDYPIPDFINRDEWLAFCEVRKAKNNPVNNPHTANALIKKLIQLSNYNRETATAIIQQSIECGYTTFFKLKPEFENNSAQAERRKTFDEKNKSKGWIDNLREVGFFDNAEVVNG